MMSESFVGAWELGPSGWTFAIVGPDEAELYQTRHNGFGLYEMTGGAWREVKGHRNTKLFAGCMGAADVEKKVREMFGPEGGRS